MRAEQGTERKSAADVLAAIVGRKMKFQECLRVVPVDIDFDADDGGAGIERVVGGGAASPGQWLLNDQAAVDAANRRRVARRRTQAERGAVDLPRGMVRGLIRINHDGAGTFSQRDRMSVETERGDVTVVVETELDACVFEAVRVADHGLRGEWFQRGEALARGRGQLEQPPVDERATGQRKRIEDAGFAGGIVERSMGIVMQRREVPFQFGNAFVVDLRDRRTGDEIVERGENHAAPESVEIRRFTAGAGNGFAELESAFEFAENLFQPTARRERAAVRFEVDFAVVNREPVSAGGEAIEEIFRVIPGQRGQIAERAEAAGAFADFVVRAAATVAVAAGEKCFRMHVGLGVSVDRDAQFGDGGGGVQCLARLARADHRGSFPARQRSQRVGHRRSLRRDGRDRVQLFRGSRDAGDRGGSPLHRDGGAASGGRADPAPFPARAKGVRRRRRVLAAGVSVMNVFKHPLPGSRWGFRRAVDRRSGAGDRRGLREHGAGAGAAV